MATATFLTNYPCRIVSKEVRYFGIGGYPLKAFAPAGKGEQQSHQHKTGYVFPSPGQEGMPNMNFTKLKKIESFLGEYRFLSNFWPCRIAYDNLIYPSTEHAYQAAKVTSVEMKTLIRDSPTPADAKEYSNTHHLGPDRKLTAEDKIRIMEELLLIKFSGQEPLLTRSLLLTGDAELIEGNTWNDTFWGVCNNSGENHLGKLLVKVRTTLLAQKEELVSLLESGTDNATVAAKRGISIRELYEKLIAFSIPNKEFWIG